MQGLLELLQGAVVQVEPGVPGEVQLLQLGGQVLWQGDVTQLITAQVHTLAPQGGER